MNSERKYILHLDGDSFFASVESAKNPALRNRPIVTGFERGIASAVSYEAKKLGVTRTMPIFQIRKLFPSVIVVSSDYEAYAVFSRRMFDIVRRYTDIVEEYSIDECFADFSHNKAFKEDPRPILERIKSDIVRELGITVSLGLGPSKVIAKTASKRNKPNGLTILSPLEVPEVLSTTPIASVWGIGSSSTHALQKLGVSTALEFAHKPVSWVKEHFSKPLIEMWYELNSISINEVSKQSESQKSIMKTRTFSPASKDRAYVFSELSKNIENASKKAREMRLSAQGVSIYLKTTDFSFAGDSVKFHIPTNSTFDIVAEVQKIFDSVFSSDRTYRATGVTLYGLMPDFMGQEDLFGARVKGGSKEKILGTIDKLNKKYGRSLVHLASSSSAIKKEERYDKEEPYMNRGNFRKLCVPYLGEVS